MSTYHPPVKVQNRTRLSTIPARHLPNSVRADILKAVIDELAEEADRNGADLNLATFKIDTQLEGPRTDYALRINAECYTYSITTPDEDGMVSIDVVPDLSRWQRPERSIQERAAQLRRDIEERRVHRQVVEGADEDMRRRLGLSSTYRDYYGLDYDPIGLQPHGPTLVDLLRAGHGAYHYVTDEAGLFKPRAQTEVEQIAARAMTEQPEPEDWHSLRARVLADLEPCTTCTPTEET